MAAKLGRKFITGDVSPVAVRVMSKRLNDMEHSPEFEVLNVPRTKEEWLELNGHIFAEKICEFMGWQCNTKKSNDGGIDGWALNNIPIQIKNHKNKTSRPEIQKFIGAMSGVDQGIFVSWDFSHSAWEYIIKAEKEFKKKIQFIKVEDILDDILIDSEKQKQINELTNKTIKENIDEIVMDKTG